jgi:hypothetical protein
MKKLKILIAVILITGMMLLLILLGVGIMLVVAHDITAKNDGVLSILAFVVAAFVFGTCTNRVINLIKILWQ